jgi:hypothetical protein
MDELTMMRKPFPIKLFCGLIGPVGGLASARRALEREFGPVEMESPVEVFGLTDYYEAEMGRDLRRMWIAFSGLRERAYLVEAKRLAVIIEGRLARGGRRSVNIDPGYVDNAQVVLATAKNFAHRIYIGAGYYAEVTLLHVDGTFRFLDWTYPDYRSASALAFFSRVRASYHREMKRSRDS